MNKKGSSLGLAILSTIGVFIIGLMFVNFLMPEVSNFRIDLNCASASTISDGNKLLCLVGDGTVPIFVVGIISLGIGAITRRFIF